MLIWILGLGINNSWGLSMVSNVVDCPIDLYSSSKEEAKEEETKESKELIQDKVKIFISTASNTRGGWDSDLATYDSDAQYRNYQIATCTVSLFSMYGVDIPKITATEREML